LSSRKLKSRSKISQQISQQDLAAISRSKISQQNIAHAAAAVAAAALSALRWLA